MENKVTVIGFKHSGKTSYLVGMYTIMSGGRKNFSLIATDSNLDLQLDNLWGQMCDGKFPLANDNREKYTFHISHNYKPVCDFDWLDYPGGILKDPNSPFREELNKSVSEADCLLLILDGELFNIDASSTDEYEEKLIRKLDYDDGLRSEAKALTRLSVEGVDLPPIAIVVTKCDLINSNYQESVEKVLHSCEILKGIFAEHKVITTSVSLGANIDKGNGPNPFCIEQPIAFAVLAILIKYLTALKYQKSANAAIANKKRNLVNTKKIEEALKNLKVLNEISDKWSADAYKLIELFPEKKHIYINGQDMSFRDYFRNEFIELAK